MISAVFFQVAAELALEFAEATTSGENHETRDSCDDEEGMPVDRNSEGGQVSQEDVSQHDKRPGHRRSEPSFALLVHESPGGAAHGGAEGRCV